MSAVPRRAIVGSGFVLLAVVSMTLLSTVQSQGGTATSTMSTSAGTTTYSTIGSTSYGTTTTYPTTSTNTAYAMIQEGFELSSGSYHVASSNATVMFASDHASEGSRSLSAQCAGPCFVDLWFDLEGWLTYSALIQLYVTPPEAAGQFIIEAGSANRVFGFSNMHSWEPAYHQISQCVETVHFLWRAHTAGTLYFDQVEIERSTTTQSPTPNGGSSCGGSTTRPYCAPYTSNGYTVYPTCSPTTTTTTHYDCATSTWGPYTGSPTPEWHTRCHPPTTTGYCYDMGSYTTCYAMPYCNHPATATTTCQPTPTYPVISDCMNEDGYIGGCTRGATVTVTKTVAAPNVTGWATLGVLGVAAAFALARKR